MKRVMVKCVLVSRDGKHFLLTREFYCQNLLTSELYDGKTFQGRTFILLDEDDEKTLLQEQGNVKNERTKKHHKGNLRVHS